MLSLFEELTDLQRELSQTRRLHRTVLDLHLNLADHALEVSRVEPKVEAITNCLAGYSCIRPCRPHVHSHLHRTIANYHRSIVLTSNCLLCGCLIPQHHFVNFIQHCIPVAISLTPSFQRSSFQLQLEDQTFLPQKLTQMATAKLRLSIRQCLVKECPGAPLQV